MTGGAAPRRRAGVLIATSISAGVLIALSLDAGVLIAVSLTGLAGGGTGVTTLCVRAGIIARARATLSMAGITSTRSKLRCLLSKVWLRCPHTFTTRQAHIQIKFVVISHFVPP